MFVQEHAESECWYAHGGQQYLDMQSHPGNTLYYITVHKNVRMQLIKTTAPDSKPSKKHSDLNWSQTSFSSSTFCGLGVKVGMGDELEEHQPVIEERSEIYGLQSHL